MIKIREIQTEEYGFLWKMLYQAIYSPTQQLPESIVYQPSLAKYAAAFGKEGDYCFVLAWDDQLVGAAWSRLLTADQKGYGFVDESTPEVSMAVEPAFRGKGYGRVLLERLIEKLREEGYHQLCLSVDKQNRAIHLYRRLDFILVAEEGTACTMLRKLA